MTEPTEQQILEAAFAPAQPAAEASRFGSPELQAMIIARCVEKDQADSVRDYPPLPDFDSADEPIWNAIFNWETAAPGSEAQRKANTVESVIINQLRAYIDADRAARSPTDSVLEDAARLDWLLLRISGAEFRRVGVHYSGNASRADVDAARKLASDGTLRASGIDSHSNYVFALANRAAGTAKRAKP